MSSAVVVLLLAWLALGFFLLRRLAENEDFDAVIAALTWATQLAIWAALVVVARNQSWPVSTSFESVTPVPLLIGVALVSAAISGVGSALPVFYFAAPVLEADGIYRYSRHPLALGLLLSAVGVAIVGHSGAGLAIVALMAISLAIYLPAEERYLQRQLGEGYRRYRARAPFILGRPAAGTAASGEPGEAAPTD